MTPMNTMTPGLHPMYQSEIGAMMYIFGEVQDPLDQVNYII